MEKSQSIKELAKALSLFQTKMEKIKKDSINPFHKNKYASLSTILEHIQIPLAECNLSFSQLPDGEHLVTILIHLESGEYLQSNYLLSPSKLDPQGVGSAITYARRYALGAILGLNIDEDDDANKASRLNGQQQSNNNGGGKSNIELEVDRAIKQLQVCNNIDELTMLKDSLEAAVLNSKRFINAGLKRYKEITQPS